MKLRPPTYDETDPEPLAADDWLREIEKKLNVIKCTDDEERVTVATHQLTGAPRDWWDSYSGAHQNPANISWEDFVEAFIEHHIPEGVFEAKTEEFRNIRMGKDKICEYTTRFTSLLRYAPPAVKKDEKEKGLLL